MQAPATKTAAQTFPLSINTRIYLKNEFGAGLADSFRAVNWTAEQIAQHLSSGYAISVSTFKDNYRKQANVIETRVLGLDLDEGEQSAEALAMHEVLSDLAAIILPTASDTPEHPRSRVICLLSRHVTKDELKQFRQIFVKLLPDLTLDTSVFDSARMLYGSKPDPKRVHVRSDVVLDVDQFLEQHAALVDPEPAASQQKTEARRKVLEAEGAALHNVAKTSGKEIRRAVQLVTAILDDCVAKNEKLPNDVWYQLRLAAQAASGSALEVFEAIVNHAYWRAEWDKETELKRWLTETPHSVTVGTLYAMAAERNALIKNAAEPEPTHTINTLAELPLTDSYLLRALTGIGKSQAQRPTIANVLARGLKVVWIVPTKSLAKAAATDFKEHGAVVYLDEDGKIKDARDLRAEQFIVTTPQTFTRRIASRGLYGYGLLVLDEVQQIADAVHKTNHELWSHSLAEEFWRAIDGALRQRSLIVRGLDAGISKASQLWLNLPLYDCLETPEKAPVTIMGNEGALLSMLDQVVGETNGLVYVTCDTKAMSTAVYADLSRHYPHKRVLLVNSDTTDTRLKSKDPRALAFMADPNAEVHNYDVIIVSPTMLTGVSIVSRKADYVFQSCRYLPPKSNLQMLNRVREQGHVFVNYRGTEYAPLPTPPEKAEQFAEALLLGLPALPRSAFAQKHDLVAYMVAVDQYAQSRAPMAYYKHLLERDGRYVEVDAETEALFELMFDETHKELLEFALDNWQDYKPYERGKTYRDLEPKELDAMLMKAKIDAKTEGGWPVSQNKRQTAEAALQFKNGQLILSETAIGMRELRDVNERIALDPDASLALLSRDRVLLWLFNVLEMLGYEGETVIPAQQFVDRGSAIVAFVKDNEKYWNAAMRPKRLELTGNDTNDARKIVKDLLGAIGLQMRQGKLVRLADGTRHRDADVENVAELKHLLYLRACGRAKTALPDGIELVFKRIAREETVAANVDAMKWLEKQPEPVWIRVKQEIKYSGDIAKACYYVKSQLDGTDGL